jgi:hypothetical protein
VLINNAGYELAGALEEVLSEDSAHNSLQQNSAAPIPDWSASDLRRPLAALSSGRALRTGGAADLLAR